MGEASKLNPRAGLSSGALDLSLVDAPIALCTARGALAAATDRALSLLRRASSLDGVPEAVPPDLWRLLERTPSGEAVEWRSLAAPHDVIGCTRYAAAPGSYVLLLREVSSKRLALVERLEQARVASTRRLVSSVAHDLRSAVASVVYGAEFLGVSTEAGASPALRDAVADISKATVGLQGAIDALLDHAGIGPTFAAPVSIRGVLHRALGLVHAEYHEGSHRIRMDVAPHAEWVRGNPLAIEQIFVSLLLNAVEASAAPRCVIVTAFPAVRAPKGDAAPRIESVCTRVWDDGPGIPPELRRLVFEPFFSTKQGSLGLGLAIAREAAERLDGALELVDDDSGTCFEIHLPRHDGPR